MNKANNDGATPLLVAAQEGRMKLADLLVENDHVVIDAEDSSGTTPLYVAAQNGETAIAALLLKKGADANNRGGGVSPLWIAAQEGHRDLVELLVTDGHADVNLPARSNGATPLYVAAQNGHVDVAAVLVAHSADVNQASSDGVTPLFIAAQKGATKVVELLVQKGNVNQANNNGVDPLAVAAEQGRTDIAALLIRNEADVNHADDEGWTPLHKAATTNRIDVVSLLLDAPHIAVDRSKKDGATPLLLAVLKGHIDVAVLLITKGHADVHAEVQGWSLAMIAKKGGHRKLVDILENEVARKPRRCEVTVDGEVFHPLGIQIEQDWVDDGVAGSTLMTEAEAWRYMDSFCAGRRIGGGARVAGQEQGPERGSCAEQLMVHCSNSYVMTAPRHPDGSFVLSPPHREDPRPVALLMSRLASLEQVVTLAEYTDLLGEVSSGGIAHSAADDKETTERVKDGTSSSSRANEGGSSATISSAGSGDTLDSPTTMEHVVVLATTSWSTRDRLPALWNMSLREFPPHNIAWARAYEPARNGHEANPLLWEGRRPEREGKLTAWERAQSVATDTIHNRIHKYLRRTSHEEVRWFLIIDDDMWINAPSLLRFINRPRAGGDRGGSVEHNLPVAFGHGWPWFRWDETSDFLTAGILLSREAMVRFSQHLYTGKCPRPPSWNSRRSMSNKGADGREGGQNFVEGKATPCDIFVSKCLFTSGVALIASPFHYAIPPHLQGYPGGEHAVIEKSYLKKEQSRDEEPNELRLRVAMLNIFEYESAIIVNGFIGNKALEMLAKRVRSRRKLLKQALSSDSPVDSHGGLLKQAPLGRWWYHGANPPAEFDVHWLV